MFRVLFRDLGYHFITEKKPTSQILHFNVFFSVLVQKNENPSLKSINKTSFTVDYLVNSCGLPQDKALTLAKKFNLCSTEKADSVISLFESYGFTKTHITKLISLRPQLLSADPNKTLKPKFDFLCDLGVSQTDFLKLWHSIFTHSLENVLKPNISIFQIHGVPNHNIVRLLISNPLTLGCSSNRVKESVEKIKSMGFNPLSPMFCRAVGTMASINESNWDKKLMAYREFGLLENDVISAFKKHPYCMNISEEKIRRSLEFLQEKLKCKPTDISLRPVLLLYSLEKRIIPRCAVLKILFTKGIIRKKLDLVSVFIMAEKAFSKKFVVMHLESVPEVMKAYKGEIGFAGFEDVVEVKDCQLTPI